MEYRNYIKTELLILVPVLYYVSVGLRKSKMPNRWIPLSLGLVSIALSAIWVISTESISGIHQFCAAGFTSITQGVLVAGASVYVGQLAEKKEKTDEKPPEDGDKGKMKRR